MLNSCETRQKWFYDLKWTEYCSDLKRPHQLFFMDMCSTMQCLDFPSLFIDLLYIIECIIYEISHHIFASQSVGHRLWKVPNEITL